ncbi:MAG: alpha/beta hydrolase [Deinococcota bacterium]|nr:alpha/beta hydrolase [Deinococcota bacterium]
MRPPARRRPGLKRVLPALLLLALGVALGFGYATLRRPALVPLQDAMVTGVAMNEVSVRYLDEAGGFIDIGPADAAADTLLILYPGGLVRPQAYTWLGVALVPLGVRTLIPRFALDLAVTAPGRASALLDILAQDGVSFERVVLGGHSLGGAMAARYAFRNPGRIDALVLMGAYSAEGDDLSATGLPVLVLAAERDGRATLAAVTAGLGRLPPGAELEVVAGAVHSFFGRYGPQAGDGLPAVSRDVAERLIREALARFVPRHPPDGLDAR